MKDIQTQKLLNKDNIEFKNWHWKQELWIWLIDHPTNVTSTWTFGDILPIKQAYCVMGGSNSSQKSIWPWSWEVNWVLILSSVYMRNFFKGGNVCQFWSILSWEVGGVTLHIGCNMLMLMAWVWLIARENYKHPSQTAPVWLGNFHSQYLEQSISM